MPLEESLREEHSPGCNHLFSFITGEMEKVREIIRTLEWSQSFTPPVRSPLRVIHLASLPPSSSSSYSSLYSSPPASARGLATDIIHEHLQRWIFHSRCRDEKGAAPLTRKLTYRRSDCGRTNSFRAEPGHAETRQADGGAWQNERLRNLFFMLWHNKVI